MIPPTPRSMRALPFAVLALFAAPAAPAQSGEEGAGTLFAVRAAEMVLGEGERVEDGVLLVEGGRIRAAGRGIEVPAGTPVIEHEGVLSAGMVACQGFSGVAAEAMDPTRALLAEARLADAFDPDHSDYAQALSSGVTSLVLAPARANVAGGVTAVVKTAGGRILRPAAHLHLSFTGDALWPNRRPTSAAGAALELEARLREPEGVYAEAAAGRLPVLLEARQRDEIQRALAFATRHGLNGALAGAALGGELADEVARSGLAVVVGPFGGGAPRRVLEGVVALAEAGVPLAFGLDTPIQHPEHLRFAAAQCVRQGLEADTAWSALTSGGARVAGVADSVGRLEAGMDADFVLWSGDPLDLSSRVEAVYVDGALAHGGGL